MSSDSDHVAFGESVDPQDNTVLFQQKRWTYITDSTSNGGVFNGQLQFDLNTLSSQNQWTDLSQAYIQFPVKLSINSATGATAETHVIDNFAASIKNGFHQFVDSVSIVLGGSNIQSSQIFENVNTSYKLLSQWSQDELRNYGPSLGVSLDTYSFSADSALTTRDGLDNVALTTLSPAYAGVQYPVERNVGFKERAQFLNSSVTSTSTASAILGTNATTEGKGRVATLGTASSVITANQDVYVQFMLATIRLKDLSDALAKIPLVKNLKGFIYVNYNAASCQYLATAATGVVKTTAPVQQAIYGRCMPAMLNTTVASTTTDLSLTFRAEVSGVPSTTTGFTTATPAFNNARLFAPYYIANPEVDRALSMKKTIRFNERFVTTVPIAANGSFSGTLSPGITNPQRVILLPVLTGTAASSAGLGAFAVNPLLSPWDIAGTGGSSPFAGLKDLQITVGGQPMWQSPVQFQYENFLQEVVQQGVDGGIVSQSNSGLIGQTQWNQNYRYYTCDVSRRMGGDDGASKAVQLSCTNSTGAPMTVIAMIWYQREIVIDTAMGSINQSL